MKNKFLIGVLIAFLFICFTSISCGASNITDDTVAKEILRLQQELENKNSEIEDLEKQIEELEGQIETLGEESLPVEESSKTNESEIGEEEIENDETEVYGTKKSPAGVGEKYKVTREDWLNGQTTLEIELTEVISGDEAWNIVKNANMFNDEPLEGKEYILAKFKIQILDSEEDPFELNHSYFSVISGEGIEYTDFISVSGLEPDLRADVYIGAIHEGWTYFLVDKDDNDPLAVFDRKYDSEIWFKLRQ